MGKHFLIYILLIAQTASTGEVIKTACASFSAGHRYGEVLPKTMRVTLKQRGFYRLSAQVNCQTESFSAAQIEVYQTLIIEQGDKVTLGSDPRNVEVYFQTSKSGTQNFIFKMISYTAGQNVYWKNIKLEQVKEIPSSISLFDLWRNFRSGITTDSKLTRWKLDNFKYARPKLPPSPTIPGQVVIGRPTLESIGFRWPIKKDYNRNGHVKVQFRQQGSKKWRPAQDMLRMMFEKAGFSRLSWSYTCPNQYAGSIIGLNPDSTYEIKLSLIDPDGGSCEKIISAKTRKVISSDKAERIVDVYPGTLRKAYAKAAPGDTLMLHPGKYSFSSKNNPNRYANTRKYIFPPNNDKDRSIYEDFSAAVNDSAVKFDKSGTAEKPITIRGTDKNKVIIDGGTSAILFDFTNAKYHCFANMTLQNAEYVFFSNNAHGISINNCIIKDCRYGIVAGSGDLKKLYTQSQGSTSKVYDIDIYNNNITGNWGVKEWHQGWSRYTKETGYQKLRFSSGIMLGGQGHAVFNNRISQFWDGFGMYFIVSPQKDSAYHNSNIDLYNNHISSCPDDCIEVDFSVNNVRIYKNFIGNSHMGISCQPVFGGPAYIFKNVIFNSRMFAFKFSRSPAGVLVYNNTCIVARGGRYAPEWQNSKILNNLFIGNSDIDTGPLWTGITTPYTSELDYNGYNRCGPGKVLWTYGNANATIMAKGFAIFKDMEDFSKKTRWENNAFLNIKTDQFKQYIKPDFSYVDASKLDVRPALNAPFVDRGKLIHNINDDYSGTAPAIGAYDSGNSLYIYGPKTGEFK